jgi:hypothetical protein
VCVGAEREGERGERGERGGEREREREGREARREPESTHTHTHTHTHTVSLMYCEKGQRCAHGQRGKIYIDKEKSTEQSAYITPISLFYYILY